MLVVLAARPFYVGWLKHDGPETEKRPANKLGFVDLQLVKIANWLFAVIVVKMFPAILNADIGWYVALLVLFAIAPFYAAWIKNDGQAMNPA